jgi:hypothetical protein
VASASAGAREWRAMPPGRMAASPQMPKQPDKRRSLRGEAVITDSLHTMIDCFDTLFDIGNRPPTMHTFANIFA